MFSDFVRDLSGRNCSQNGIRRPPPKIEIGGQSPNTKSATIHFRFGTFLQESAKKVDSRKSKAKKVTTARVWTNGIT